MQSFFTQNLDYVYFSYGAAFFLLGVAAVIFYSREWPRKTQTIGWIWLAFFGFLHAINEWLDLLAVSSLNESAFLPQRITTLALSFIMLLEFARSSVVFLDKRRVNVWVYAAPYAVFCAGLLFIEDPGFLTLFIRFVLGFPAGLATGYVFWRYARRQERVVSRNIFLCIAIAFVLYAAPLTRSGVDGGIAFFGLIAPLRGWSAFHDLAFIPLVVCRSLAATVIAFLLIHEATKSVLSSPVGNIRGRRRYVLVYSFLVFYVTLIIGSYFLVSTAERYERRHLKALIMSDAKSQADVLGMADIRHFVSGADISVYKKYLTMHNRLTQLAELSFYTKALYLVTPGEKGFLFVVGSVPQVFPHGITPSFGKDVPEKGIVDALYSKKPTMVGPYRTSAGEATYSVFFPVVDADGQAHVLLGVDIDATRLQGQVSRTRLFVIGMCLTLLLFLVVGYAFLIIFAIKGIELEIQKNNLDQALLHLRETQRELARSEETFRGILNNSPNAIFGFDRDLRLIFWNQGAEKLYGYSKSEVIDEKDPILSRKVTDVLGVEESDIDITSVFAGQTLARELTQKNVLGEIIDVAFTAFPVKDPQGHILFALGLAQDISTHKRYEEKLADANARLKSVLDGAPQVSINATDLNGVIRMWNRGSDAIFGYTADEVIGKTPVFWHDQQDLKAFEEEISKKTGRELRGFDAIVDTARNGGILLREWILVKRDGTRFPMELTIAGLHNDKGELVGYLGIGVDRTGARRAEKELLETQQKYTDLIENLNVGVYINTPGAQGHFIEANPALLKMFECDTIEGLVVSSLYKCPDERKRFSDYLLANRFAKNFEFQARTTRGRIFWASVTAVVKQDEKYGEVFYGIIQDISEQKHLETALFEERDRLKTIADSIGAGLSLIDKDFNIIWVNAVLEKWFGRLQDIRGRKCFETYQFRNYVCDGCPSRLAMQTGRVHSAEEKAVFPDGRVMDFLLICTPVKNERGEVEQVLELTLDITERKSVMEMLEFERALSRNVIDSISDTLLVLDCDTRTVLDVNRRYLELTGRTKEEIVGKSCGEVHRHACPVCEGSGFEEVVKRGRTVEATHVHVMPDGREVYQDVVLSPLRDDKGRIIGVIHIAHDVTDRKRMEDELKRYSHDLEKLIEERTRALQVSELMFRNLFEAAQNGILIIDAQSGNIINANPFLLQLLECTRDELMDHHYNSVSFLKDDGVYDRVFQELREKTSVLYDDVAIRTCQGRFLDVEFRASTYFVEKQKVIQCNIRDITERKKLDKIKTEFVSMVSHELRTPLSAIKEGVEIVVDGTQGKVNKGQKECLSIALSNIKRLNRLIGDILDITKIQSNLLKVNLAPCEVFDVIDQVYNIVKIEIEKRGLLFVTDCSKEMPAVMADRDRLIQVLMNLVNNAIKFTRERSRIVLSARRVDDVVEFGVRDEGAGISPEEAVRLFGKFVQLDSTLVRRVGGTGLGLYISRNLVEAMGGRIWVESTPGEGAIFRFTLPVKNG